MSFCLPNFLAQFLSGSHRLDSVLAVFSSVHRSGGGLVRLGAVHDSLVGAQVLLGSLVGAGQNNQGWQSSMSKGSVAQVTQLVQFESGLDPSVHQVASSQLHPCWQALHGELACA